MVFFFREKKKPLGLLEKKIEGTAGGKGTNFESLAVKNPSQEGKRSAPKLAADSRHQRPSERGGGQYTSRNYDGRNDDGGRL